MKIAIAQIKLIIGDFASNTKNIIENIEKAIENNANLIIFPELTTTVKGAKDLLFRCEYLEKSNDLINQLLPFSKNMAILIGAPKQNKDGSLSNTALLLRNEKIEVVAKQNRINSKDLEYFSPKKWNQIFKVEKTNFYPMISDDTLENTGFETEIEEAGLKNIGVDWIIQLNSTPFVKEKQIQPIVGVNSICVNHVGLAQELIYNGGSFVSNQNGEIIELAPNLEEQLIIIDTENLSVPQKVSKQDKQEQIFKTLSFAFKEFCAINRFSKALIGLSGGIDSALTAVIMCDAIGAENVLGITMPSKYSTEGSWNDSYDLAKNLGMECRTISIKPLFDTFINDIQGQSYFDLAEENLQARLRGNILMAFSNRENRVLVSTGNKSEVAMGYCTLYGDTCGGINLISDLYKQEVYALSNWINKDKEIIPTNTITKAPSAELRPDQKDQDSLPPYEVLDEILYRFIEENQTIEEISQKFDKKLVCEIVNKLNGMEFKRNQLTYCLKLSKKALLERDYPVVNRFRY